MILEYPSEVFFFYILYKSSGDEAKFKCRKLLEFKYVCMARK